MPSHYDGTLIALTAFLMFSLGQHFYNLGRWQSAMSRRSIHSFALLPIAAIWLALALSVLAKPATAASFPYQLNNCGRTLTFKAPPKRVVTIGQGSTELLLELGLKDRIVGTSLWFGPLPEKYAYLSDKLPRLAYNSPGFESVLSTHPDLVMAQYTYDIGPQGAVSSADQFLKLGVNPYISPSDCESKAVTASSNADGARSTPFDFSQILQEVNEVARLFDVPERAEDLISSLRQRIDAVSHRTQTARTEQSVVFWFSSAKLDGDVWVAGNNGVPAYIARQLGLRNLVDIGEEWPAVSWERIAQLDPDILVVTSMERRRYPADDVLAKLEFLHSDPVASQLKAVRNNNIVIVDAQALNPTLRIVNGLESISFQLHQEHGH
ncbi:Vitamin B12-binding protein [Carnimonas sp. R-84865]